MFSFPGTLFFVVCRHEVFVDTAMVVGYGEGLVEPASQQVELEAVDGPRRLSIIERKMIRLIAYNGYLGTGAPYYALNHFFPPPELGKVDEYDYYQTLTPGEKAPFGIIVGLPPDSNPTWEEHSQTKTVNEVFPSKEV